MCRYLICLHICKTPRICKIYVFGKCRIPISNSNMSFTYPIYSQMCSRSWGIKIPSRGDLSSDPLTGGSEDWLSHQLGIISATFWGQRTLFLASFWGMTWGMTLAMSALMFNSLRAKVWVKSLWRSEFWLESFLTDIVYHISILPVLHPESSKFSYSSLKTHVMLLRHHFHNMPVNIRKPISQGTKATGDRKYPMEDKKVLEWKHGEAPNWRLDLAHLAHRVVPSSHQL